MCASIRHNSSRCEEDRMTLIIQRPTIPNPLSVARGGTGAQTAAAARDALGLGDLATLTAPGGTSTFLRADKTWAVPPGGGSAADLAWDWTTSTSGAVTNKHLGLNHANPTLATQIRVTDLTVHNYDASALFHAM